MTKKGIYSIIREETYSNGQVIMDEAGSGDGPYIVLKGAVETSKDIRGRRYIIERLRPGEIFGEISLIGGMKRTLTVRSIGETTLGVIDRDALKKEYEQLSLQFRSILETIPVRIRKILDRAADLSG